MHKLISASVTGAVAVALAIVSAAAAGPSTERFSLIDTSTSASHPPVFSAIATGAFTAGGTATETKKPTKEIILRFPAGTITLTGGGGNPPVTKIQTATACLQTKQWSASYTIASGTGAYKGTSGSGTMNRHETFVEAASGGSCANAFLAVQAIITASGPVSMP